MQQLCVYMIDFRREKMRVNNWLLAFDKNFLMFCELVAELPYIHYLTSSKKKKKKNSYFISPQWPPSPWCPLALGDTSKSPLLPHLSLLSRLCLIYTFTHYILTWKRSSIIQSSNYGGGSPKTGDSDGGTQSSACGGKAAKEELEIQKRGAPRFTQTHTVTHPSPKVPGDFRNEGSHTSVSLYYIYPLTLASSDDGLITFPIFRVPLSSPLAFLLTILRPTIANNPPLRHSQFTPVC